VLGALELLALRVACSLRSCGAPVLSMNGGQHHALTHEAPRHSPHPPANSQPTQHTQPPTTPQQLLGQNLSDMRRSVPPLGPHTVTVVGLSTLAAIREVHTAGLIHRDVKPANFVVEPPGASIDNGEPGGWGWGWGRGWG